MMKRDDRFQFYIFLKYKMDFDDDFVSPWTVAKECNICYSPNPNNWEPMYKCARLNCPALFCAGCVSRLIDRKGLGSTCPYCTGRMFSVPSDMNTPFLLDDTPIEYINLDEQQIRDLDHLVERKRRKI
jgi:hypothetical protein